MKAYAILDGGGVKGSALAGCLLAAQENGVEFVGYGGTSAGAIVALLAAVGYSPRELRAVLRDTDFSLFLDDGGKTLLTLQQAATAVQGARWWNLVGLLRYGPLMGRLGANLGLYTGNGVTSFLKSKCCERLGIEPHRDVTFGDLEDKKCYPLRLVASDLRSRAPKVYGGPRASDTTDSVLDAVRASMSYPIVFQPTKSGSRYLVDGGLTTNLPLYLFEEERSRNGLPVVAFDLVSQPEEGSGNYGLALYCRDMLSTALEAGDYFQRLTLRNVHHVKVPVPAKFGTLRFGITREEREELFTIGYAAASAYFHGTVPQWAQSKDQVERLQALYAPATVVGPLLQCFAKEISDGTGAQGVRASVMLPTDRGTRIVVYHYGMENDPDIDLELDLNAGCSGEAWVNKAPAFADLELAKTSFANWKMTQAQQNKVRPSQKAMFSLPIFDSRDSPLGTEELPPCLAVLSADTLSTLGETKWLTTHKESVINIGKKWARILARVLD